MLSGPNKQGFAKGRTFDGKLGLVKIENTALGEWLSRFRKC